jgi:hypothetical protein
MLRRLHLRVPRLCLAGLLVFSLIGGHWAVLQSTAWVSMVADFRAEGLDLGSAVKRTLSGEQPCELCRGIQDARAQEQQSPATRSAVLKVDFVAPASAGVLAGPLAVSILWPAGAVCPLPEGCPSTLLQVPRHA